MSLSPEQKTLMLEMAQSRTEDRWTHSYIDIAKHFGVTRPLVSIYCNRAGIPPRQSGTGRRAKAVDTMPPEYQPLFGKLVRKVGFTAARKAVREMIEKGVAP